MGTFYDAHTAVPIADIERPEVQALLNEIDEFEFDECYFERDHQNGLLALDFNSIDCSWGTAAQITEWFEKLATFADSGFVVRGDSDDGEYEWFLGPAPIAKLKVEQDFLTNENAAIQKRLDEIGIELANEYAKLKGN